MVFSKLASMMGIKPKGPAAPEMPQHRPVQTTYTSNDVPIPDAFLTTPPAKPITSAQIDWATSPLPQYAGHIALLLENVLSPEECTEILALAEASVPAEEGKSAWRPALLNIGPGWEVAAPGYRESDRIIWNQQEVVNRLWERCCHAQGLRELLATNEAPGAARGGKWEFRRLNERMRFLKYSQGQYFKPHCDGPYYCEEDGKELQTRFTVHLYLNDSHQQNPQSELVGGATAFLDRNNEKTRVDVNPKMGSVLIFQHKGLYHEGAAVKKGIKYTMRTDILYELVFDGKPEETKEQKDKAVEDKTLQLKS